MNSTVTDFAHAFLVADLVYQRGARPERGGPGVIVDPRMPANVAAVQTPSGGIAVYPILKETQQADGYSDTDD